MHGIWIPFVEYICTFCGSYIPF